MSKHQTLDKIGLPETVPGMRAREEKAVEVMKAKVSKIDEWLHGNPEDKKGVTGKPVQSSMTDADSAKMMTSHGVVQGYNGIAAVDAKHQVIVGAEAFGSANEAEVLVPVPNEHHVVRLLRRRLPTRLPVGAQHERR